MVEIKQDEDEWNRQHLANFFILVIALCVLAGIALAVLVPYMATVDCLQNLTATYCSDHGWAFRAWQQRPVAVACSVPFKAAPELHYFNESELGACK